MMRTLTWNIAITAAIYWVLTTFVETGGLSLEGFKLTGLRTLIFVIIYAAVRVAMIMFKGDKK